MIEFGVLQPLVEVEHLGDKRDHTVVAGFINRIGEVDPAEGTIRNFLRVASQAGMNFVRYYPPLSAMTGTRG
jgi:hypothetical protein